MGGWAVRAGDGHDSHFTYMPAVEAAVEEGRMAVGAYWGLLT